MLSDLPLICLNIRCALFKGWSADGLTGVMSPNRQINHLAEVPTIQVTPKKKASELFGSWADDEVEEPIFVRGVVPFREAGVKKPQG